MGQPRATLTAYTGPRPDVIGLVPVGVRRALDIGCSDGSLGAGLRAIGAEVWGIEYDKAFAARASERLDEVLQGDAQFVMAEVPADPPFDAVICADVLEHLADPEGVMRHVHRVLSDDGVLVVSLPNVRFWTSLTALAFKGTWPAKDRGVHDRTHLRWFTDKDARSLFARHGFMVRKAITHYRLSDLPGKRRNRLARYVAVGPMRHFLAYQLLYQLVKA